MSYLTQYADQAAALAARPELMTTPDDGSAPTWNTSYCMLVSAYAVAPSEAADGTSVPGTLAPGVWVLDSSVTAAVAPLQLPAGVVYITPVYAGMLSPISRE